MSVARVAGVHLPDVGGIGIAAVPSATLVDLALVALEPTETVLARSATEPWPERDRAGRRRP